MPILTASDRQSGDCRRTLRPSPIALVTSVVAGGVAQQMAAYLLDRRSAARMSRMMHDPIRSATPGVGWEMGNVQVPRYRARLAERNHRVELTFADVRSPDGHFFGVEIRGYDLFTRRATSVAWHLDGPPMPPGWRIVSFGGSHFPATVEKEIDGRLVQVSATASLRNGHLDYATAQLTIDGAPSDLSEMSSAERAEVRPLLEVRTAPVPLPGAEVTASASFDWSDYRPPLTANFLRVTLHSGPIQLAAGGAQR